MRLLIIGLWYGLYLEKSKKSDDGLCPIYLCLVYGKRKLKVNTRVRILAHLWDQSRQKVKGDNPNSKRINRILFARILTIQENSAEVITSLMGHKPRKALEIYRNNSVNLKFGGADESK